MILETVILNVRPGQGEAFEAALQRARPLLTPTPGFVRLNVHKCVGAPNRYLLLVNWQTLEDHTAGFGKSDRYQELRDLLHGFCEASPTVEHYEASISLFSSIPLAARLQERFAADDQQSRRLASG